MNPAKPNRTHPPKWIEPQLTRLVDEAHSCRAQSRRPRDFRCRLNGGFRNPYCGTRPGEGEKPGIWLVGDEGVYIMFNGKLAEGERPLVIYSEQCHPAGNPDWWDYKRRHFGGDDGIEFIEAERLIPLFDRNMRSTHLNVELTETEIALSLITR